MRGSFDLSFTLLGEATVAGKDDNGTVEPQTGPDAGGLLAMKGSCRSNKPSATPILLGRQSIPAGGASLTDRSLVSQFRFTGGTVSLDRPGAESIEHQAGCQDGVCLIEVSFARQLQLARSPHSDNVHACV